VVLVVLVVVLVGVVEDQEVVAVVAIKRDSILPVNRFLARKTSMLLITIKAVAVAVLLLQLQHLSLVLELVAALLVLAVVAVKRKRLLQRYLMSLHHPLERYCRLGMMPEIVFLVVVAVLLTDLVPLQVRA
jgi:hypothetical protein